MLGYPYDEHRKQCGFCVGNVRFNRLNSYLHGRLRLGKRSPPQALLSVFMRSQRRFRQKTGQRRHVHENRFHTIGQIAGRFSGGVCLLFRRVAKDGEARNRDDEKAYPKEKPPCDGRAARLWHTQHPAWRYHRRLSSVPGGECSERKKPPLLIKSAAGFYSRDSFSMVRR